MNKRTQAAMDFLMTYGWAILVVLVAVSALAYFGVLNPQKYIPTQPNESCTVDIAGDCATVRMTQCNMTNLEMTEFSEEMKEEGCKITDHII